MFDGFPRTLAQAEMLKAQFDARGAVLSRVFLLEVTAEVSLARLCGRRICKKCGANFHVVNIPPRKEGVCDVCGGELYQRADDKESTIRNRLKIFQDQSEGLFSFYEKQGILVRVDSSRNWRDVVDEILRMIEPVA
jgi:adenylate kinase